MWNSSTYTLLDVSPVAPGAVYVDNDLLHWTVDDVVIMESDEIWTWCTLISHDRYISVTQPALVMKTRFINILPSQSNVKREMPLNTDIAGVWLTLSQCWPFKEYWRLHSNGSVNVSVETSEQTLMSLLDLSVTETVGHKPVLIACQLICLGALMSSTFNNVQAIIFRRVEIDDKSSLVNYLTTIHESPNRCSSIENHQTCLMYHDGCGSSQIHMIWMCDFRLQKFECPITYYFYTDPTNYK